MVNKMEYSQNIFYQMLNKLRNRPEMWLGTADIKALRLYIEGYHNALMDLDACTIKSQTSLFPLDFQFMHEFLKIKTNSYESTAGWENLILEECGYNEKIALERFFEYFDEFCTLKAVNMKKAILNEKNILANDNMLYSYRVEIVPNVSKNADNDDKYFRSGDFINKKPIYDSPQAIYIIELSGNNGFLCAVETSADIQLKRYIFHKDQIIGDNKCSESPEHIFGTINTLIEVPCSENPDFNKPVH